MPNEVDTRSRFRQAIAVSPTVDTAAGLVTAIHRADLKELFEELETGVIPAAFAANNPKYQALKETYGV